MRLAGWLVWCHVVPCCAFVPGTTLARCRTILRCFSYLIVISRGCLKIPSKHARHEATWSHMKPRVGHLGVQVSRHDFPQGLNRHSSPLWRGFWWWWRWWIWHLFFHVLRWPRWFFSRWKRRPPTKPSTMIRSQTKMRVKVWPSPEFGSEISWNSRHFSEFPSLDSQFQGFPSGVEIFSGIWMDIKSGSKMDLTI